MQEKLPGVFWHTDVEASQTATGRAHSFTSWHILPSPLTSSYPWLHVQAYDPSVSKHPAFASQSLSVESRHSSTFEQLPSLAAEGWCPGRHTQRNDPGVFEHSVSWYERQLCSAVTHSSTSRHSPDEPGAASRTYPSSHMHIGAAPTVVGSTQVSWFSMLQSGTHPAYRQMVGSFVVAAGS